MTTKFSLGWVRDLPDIRDYLPGDTKGHQAPSKAKNDARSAVASWFQKSAALKAAPQQLENHFDVSKFCSEIEDQGDLGSCTANAGAGLIEYFERRAFGKHLDASRLFLYKVTRKLLGWNGDTGAYLRTTMGAMALFGAPPEDQYPYRIANFDDEPTAFHYAYAQNYQSLSYFRLDQAGVVGQPLVDRIRSFIHAGYPAMFGFSVYNYGNSKGEFEFPSTNSNLLGGHAICAVGYDDQRQIGSKKGAFKIRNSWGTSWGDAGYGWLPYEYVLSGLASDFWSLFKHEYIQTGQFS
jgi:C1A family cysteine protease